MVWLSLVAVVAALIVAVPSHHPCDGGVTQRHAIGGVGYFLLFAAGLAYCFFVTTVVSKRLHDCNLSGKWAVGFVALMWLIVFVPPSDLPGLNSSVKLLPGLFTLAAIVWLGTVRGDKGPNRFGPPPDEWGLAQLLF